MFTGIIRELGVVENIKKRAHGGKLTVSSKIVKKEAGIGDSLAVNGVCLTVVGLNRGSISFDVSAETLRVTDLGKLKSGDRINLEPSLKPVDFIGGHFVSGHVEAIGEIMAKRQVGAEWLFKISAPTELIDITITRGSICVDGISLTVTKVLKSAFEVVIIPHTAKMTTLGYKKVRDSVNLESDLIGRYIKRIMDNSFSAENKKQELSDFAKFGLSEER